MNTKRTRGRPRKTSSTAGTSHPARDRNFVDVGEKLFRIIEALTENPGAPPSLDDVARNVGMAKTTAYRLLYTLKQLGYVDQTAPEGAYVLSQQFFELGRSAISRHYLPKLARPWLQQLGLRSGESVTLAILDQGAVFYLIVLESSNAYRYASTPGQCEPVHCTAVGKCLLAYRTEEEVDAIIRSRGLPRHTSRTITTGAQLHGELAKVRQQGVAYNLEENAEGVICIGAPVWGSEGPPVAAISVTGPAVRMAGILDSLRDEVTRVARRLSILMGYTEPASPDELVPAIPEAAGAGVNSSS